MGKIWLQNLSGRCSINLVENRQRGQLEGIFESLFVLRGVEALLGRVCASSAALRAQGTFLCQERLLGWAQRPQGCFAGVLARPGQGFEQVVEEPCPEGLVHPLAGEQQVVHLMHALDVAGAVPLLGFQTHLGVSCRGQETQETCERVRADRGGHC